MCGGGGGGGLKKEGAYEKSRTEKAKEASYWCIRTRRGNVLLGELGEGSKKERDV